MKSGLNFFNLTPLLTALVVLFFTNYAIANQSDPSSEQNRQLLTQKLKIARPDLTFTVVNREPVAEFYQVQVEGGPLLFVHSSGDYFFQGDLLQIQSGQIVNILETQYIEERRKHFQGRSAEDLIVFKPEGETAAIINVFTDIDCGYCRKLHREVPELNARGIEVRYLAFPRAGIPSESYNKITTAWCAENKQDVMTQLKAGKSVATDICENNPVATHLELGSAMGVTGTPAIVLMDGTMIPGYQPAADLAALLGLNSPDS